MTAMAARAGAAAARRCNLDGLPEFLPVVSALRHV